MMPQEADNAAVEGVVAIPGTHVARAGNVRDLEARGRLDVSHGKVRFPGDDPQQPSIANLLRRSRHQPPRQNHLHLLTGYAMLLA